VIFPLLGSFERLIYDSYAHLYKDIIESGLTQLYYEDLDRRQKEFEAKKIQYQIEKKELDARVADFFSDPYKYIAISVDELDEHLYFHKNTTYYQYKGHQVEHRKVDLKCELAFFMLFKIAVKCLFKVLKRKWVAFGRYL
jgi:hypothetical protein